MPDHAAFVRDYLDAWNAGDVDRIVALFHADARYVDPSHREPLVGREAIRTHVAKVLRYWPEEEWTAVRRWDHAGGCTLLWRATITSPWTGKDVTFAGLDLILLERGLVKEMLVYFDPALWRGLVPADLVPPSEDRE